MKMDIKPSFLTRRAEKTDPLSVNPLRTYSPVYTKLLLSKTQTRRCPCGAALTANNTVVLLRTPQRAEPSRRLNQLQTRCASPERQTHVAKHYRCELPVG